MKKVMENRLVGNRRHIRALIIDRALLQHESRLLERSNTVFTSGHRKTLDALLQLVRPTDTVVAV
jgi:proteasome activator subunit 4